MPARCRLMRRLPAVLLALVSALAFAGSTAHAATAPRGGLHQDGRWMLDGQGRVRIDHGVNMVYKQGSYAPEATGFGGDDARFLRRNGFTTVRLGLIWKA